MLLICMEILRQYTQRTVDLVYTSLSLTYISEQFRNIAHSRGINCAIKVYNTITRLRYFIPTKLKTYCT